MILISHRGNINGKNPERENSPDYILEALKLGYNIEIDVWYTDDGWYFGHDEPIYKSDPQNFMWYYDKLWWHCKNLQALKKIREYRYHHFFHQKDDFTLTSKNYIWTYPGGSLTQFSICVLPETVNYSEKELKECYGICSDYIENYKGLI
jgi:hypothetical protein